MTFRDLRRLALDGMPATCPPGVQWRSAWVSFSLVGGFGRSKRPSWPRSTKKSDTRRSFHHKVKTLPSMKRTNWLLENLCELMQSCRFAQSVSSSISCTKSNEQKTANMRLIGFTSTPNPRFCCYSSTVIGCVNSPLLDARHTTNTEYVISR